MRQIVLDKEFMFMVDDSDPEARLLLMAYGGIGGFYDLWLGHLAAMVEATNKPRQETALCFEQAAPWAHVEVVPSDIAEALTSLGQERILTNDADIAASIMMLVSRFGAEEVAAQFAVAEATEVARDAAPPQ